MDIFCDECAAKPGWVFDKDKAFLHSCQRCFRHRSCNDYGYRKPKQHVGAAPTPKDLVKSQINTHAQVDLPKAKHPPITPMPVIIVEEETKEVVVEKVTEVVYEGAVPPEASTIKAEERTEMDKALDAVQPNRPGIKLTTKQK